jgi:hypothetical protein
LSDSEIRGLRSRISLSLNAGYGASPTNRVYDECRLMLVEQTISEKNI